MKSFNYSSGPRRARGPLPESPEYEAHTSWTDRIKEILRSEPLVNGIMLVAIVVGFFHGWLKIHFPSPATTFLFDAFLSLAVYLVYSRQPRGTPFIPPGALGNSLKTLYIGAAIYGLLPLGPPFLVSLAAYRGWCFATLMYPLGHHLTRSANQIKGYFYVLIVLGVLTAIYGIRQSPEEIERQMQQNKEFAERYRFTYYATENGRELRVFSTFISAGAFGGVLACVIAFGVVMVTDEQSAKKDRILTGLALVPMSYALVLTASRSPLFTIILCFGLLGWYRRKFKQILLLGALLYVGFALGMRLTQGAVAERYQQLGDEIASRPFIPTMIGWQFLKIHPFGGGLGKSGYSVPMFLWSRISYDDAIWVDGDLGCLMIEMGLIGLIIFGRIFWTAAVTAYHNLKELRGTPSASVALASTICFLSTVVGLPVGSPFLSIPMGALTWFFMGSLEKLAQMHRLGIDSHPTTSNPAYPGKRLLYQKPTPGKPRSQASRWQL